VGRYFRLLVKPLPLSPQFQLEVELFKLLGFAEHAAIEAKQLV
jgi:hypothetical protein